MGTVHKISDVEYTNEILTWSITAVVVAILVIVTIVTVICILRNTPERELEVTTTDGTAGGQKNLRKRAVAYHHKYWKVTDRDAPMFDNTRRDITTHTYGTLKTREEIEREDESMYSISYPPNNKTVSYNVTLQID